MVDQESGPYRPRRAVVEPDREPEPEPSPPAAAPDVVDEDAPKPLYRDEYGPRPLYRDEAPVTEPEMPDDTAGRSIIFAPRPRHFDEDSTAILTRATPTGGRYRNGRAEAEPDDIDDLDEDERKPLGERTRWALVAGAVAAVVVVGLAIGYAVFGVGNERGTAPPPNAPGTGGSAPTTGTTSDPSPTGGVLLSDNSMLSPGQAKRLDPKRTWKVELTQRGASEDSPVAACFGSELEAGQPVSQQKILRILSSSGKSAPSVLHEATAYATKEEAGVAFSVAAQTLGTCPAAGAWIAAGRVVRGVGDQSASGVISVIDGKTTSAHSVLVSRTGRVVNIIDASRPGEALAMTGVAAALAEVTKNQCTAAGGKCADDVQVKAGPPPLGGDQPGYLAAGDLPPVGGSLTAWNAAPPDLPDENFVGASCETVNWTTVAAEQRSARVYLHPDSGNNYFGVNVNRITSKDAKAATALVDKIKKDLESCKERRLTATVDDPHKVTSVGARGIQIAGYTAVVEQKRSDGGSDKFRVGIVAAGNKVVYTFANPKGAFDFTDKQWNTIAVRAGERFTQVA